MQLPNAGDVDVLDRLSSNLLALTEESKRVGRQQQILNSLCFNSIKFRHDSIEGPHADTFQWVFKSSESNFMTWLESQNGIYWVRGKAGSGKSTLMKYLSNDDRTKKVLKVWAGQNRLFTASFFFWNAGNPMQKSQIGLLRTLLYEVLIQSPDLIPTVCSERWSSNEYHDSASWRLDELNSAFNQLKETLLPLKLCFFVDGLDEYTGELSTLINLLNRLASSSFIKLCVSSRPWNQFVNAFDDSIPHLKLEDLTRKDIERYVRNHLENNTKFSSFAHERCAKIIQDIVQRAQGVFLWVYLVVDSLLKGVVDGDNVSDMQERLDRLPVELEEYFRHMIETIDPTFRDQTARIF